VRILTIHWGQKNLLYFLVEQIIRLIFFHNSKYLLFINFGRTCILIRFTIGSRSDASASWSGPEIYLRLSLLRLTSAPRFVSLAARDSLTPHRRPTEGNSHTCSRCRRDGKALGTSPPSLPSTATPTVHLSPDPNKLLIVVTPTRARAAHAFYLTRMGQTLRLVQPPLLWVVVEAGKPTPEAAAALCCTSVIHRYVGCCDKLNASSSSSVHYRRTR
jgi:hypothetical protein